MKRGDIVCWIADPRHHGIVRCIAYGRGETTAHVQWLDTGWHSYRVPLTELRRVPAAA